MDNDKALMLSAKEALGIGEIFVKSGFFNDTHAAAQAAVKILAGRELGIGPFASMTGIYIVKGRVMLSANLMASRIKASGKYDYRIKTSDATECVIEFLQKNGDGWTSIGTSRFTMKDAVDAQVANGDNWKKYPRNMLFARAMSNGFKWFTPDLASGAPVFTPEEMGVREGVNPETGEVIEGEGAPVDAPAAEAQAEPGEGGEGEPATPAPDGIITSGPTLLEALGRDDEIADYYTDPEGQGPALWHLAGAIRKQLGNPRWKWPRPADSDGWSEAHDAAVMYARDQIAQKQAA